MRTIITEYRKSIVKHFAHGNSILIGYFQQPRFGSSGWYDYYVYRLKIHMSHITTGEHLPERMQECLYLGSGDMVMHYSCNPGLILGYYYKAKEWIYSIRNTETIG